MKPEHMQPTYIYWGGVKNEAIYAYLTKKRKTIPTHFVLVVFLLFLSYTATAQTISFNLSKDSIQSFEDLTITNTSVNLPPGTLFRWEFSGSHSLTIDSLIYHADSTTMMIAFDKNDSQFVVSPGFPTKLFRDSLYITLIATDSNGTPLPVPVYSKIIIIYLNYPFPLYPCSDLNNDPCHSIVCNGSFEDIGSFTGGPQGLINAVPWFGVDAEVFNTGFASAFWVPNNMFGSQLANTGNTYGGFHPRYTTDITKPNFPKSEVISTMLKYSLDQNQTYQVTFQTSLADRSNLATRLNAYLDIQPPFLTIHTGDHLQSAMVNNPNGVVQNGLGYITNVTQFVPVTGVFTPAQTGVYRLYIGSPDNMDVTSASGNWGANPIPGYPPTDYLAYYYIDDVEVVPLPATVVVEGYQDPDNCRLYHLSTSKPQNVASYQWSINGVPVLNATQSSVTLSNPLHLPIQCTVKNYHGCESVYTWESDPCNLLQTSAIIIRNMKISDLTDPQSSFFQYLTYNSTHYELQAGSQVVNILGTLTIDEDFTFVNCDYILMGPNAKIIVEPNVSPGINLTIQTCTITSCNFECFMWDGIYATDPNSSVLISESTISHAKNAVYSRNNLELDIQGNTFSNNLIGIHLTNHQRDCSPVPPGGIPPTPVPANVYIYANDFQGDLWNFQAFLSQYLPGFNGMEWGIRVDTVDLLTIGTNNTFDGLSCGIHINTGNVEITGNQFNSIRHHTSSPGVDEPWGYMVNAMYKEGAIVVNRQSEQGPQPMPDYCVPVYIRVTENNLFDNCRMGIYDFDHPLEVSDNNFTNTKYNAIKGLKLPEASISSNIHSYNLVQSLHPNNVFNYEYYIGQPQQSNYGYPIDIQMNTITTYKSGINLIMATSTANPAVSQNYTMVRNNHIMLNDVGTDPILQAIRIQACDRALVMMNILENIDPANYPDNSNPIPDLKGIKVTNSRDAKVYDNFLIKRFGQGVFNIGSNPGTQFWCNNFVQDYDGFYDDASSDVSPQLITTEQNRNAFYSIVNLRVDHQPGSGPLIWYWPNGYPQYDPSPYYNIMDFPGIPPEVECGPIPEGLLEEGTREALFGDVVRDEDTLYGVLQQEFAYMADEHLYNNLRNDTSLMYLGTANDSLYVQYYNYFSNTNLATIANIQEQMEQQDINTALSNNSLLSPTCQIEHYRKAVNEIYLQTWAKNIKPDSLQTDYLFNIAMIEPYIGGNAVFTARVILDIDPLNYNMAYRKSKETQQDLEVPILVYPNPASNYIFLEWIGGNGSTEGTAEVFDMQGRSVGSMILEKDCPIQSFPVKDLRKGMYLLKISLFSGKLFTSKIIVNH